MAIDIAPGDEACIEGYRQKVNASSVLKELIGGADSLLSHLHHVGRLLYGDQYNEKSFPYEIDHISPLANTDSADMELNFQGADGRGYVNVSTDNVHRKHKPGQTPSARALFHYTNMQPLSMTDNRSKGKHMSKHQSHNWNALQYLGCTVGKDDISIYAALDAYDRLVTEQGLTYGRYGLCHLLSKPTNDGRQQEVKIQVEGVDSDFPMTDARADSDMGATRNATGTEQADTLAEVATIPIVNAGDAHSSHWLSLDDEDMLCDGYDLDYLWVDSDFPMTDDDSDYN